MSQIEKLQAQISTLETEAAELDEASENYYEQLYKLLSVAYFAAKDIIELQAPDVPLTIDQGLEAKLRDAEDTNKKLATENEYLNGSLDRIREIIR